MGLTAEVGQFLANVDFDRVPSEAVATAKLGFTDCIAVMVAGWDEPACGIIRSAMAVSERDRRPLPIAALDGRIADIALVYSTAAHALDFDDTGLAGHPSAVLVPTILAQADRTAVDGRAMIAAYVAGYEVWAELRRDADQLHAKGWHPSAVLGPVAAAAASCVIHRFDADQARRAVGIAASLGGGVVSNFGSMTKPFQLGRAAQSGVIAAQLAAAGLTSAPDALEHERGFLAAISPKGEVDRARPACLGAEWQILRHGLNVKLYPVCYALHRALDAMHDLCTANDLRADHLAEVRVELGSTQAAMLRNHRPKTALAAKFSAEFGMAAMALERRCGRGELSDAFVIREDVQEFLPRVSVEPIYDKDPEEPAHSPFDRVTVRRRDGSQVVSAPVAYPRGHYRRPLRPEELWRKFEDCMSERLQRAAALRLFEGLAGLERTTSLGDLIAAARAAEVV
jgi:2-methylcitrate dehydratase PrpD